MDGGFDTFSHHSQLQTLGHRDDGFNDRRVVILCPDLLHEGAVDLEFVEREAVQIAQRRITCAKVIHRELDAHSPDVPKDLYIGLHVLQ